MNTADQAEGLFVAALVACVEPRVLELGTLRWEANRPTHHKEWAPHAREYTMSDIEDGQDVDIVADAHTLSQTVHHSYDAFIAISVWEHLKRPWIAAQEAAAVVKAGGIAYVCTHQTFPLHGYPHDYFRFSADALALIFEDAGFTTLSYGYQFPCVITPPPEVTRWNGGAESFLNVAWYGTKTH
jgi:hypothetical protein